jgi:hypothetical protein
MAKAQKARWAFVRQAQPTLVTKTGSGRTKRKDFTSRQEENCGGCPRTLVEVQSGEEGRVAS